MAEEVVVSGCNAVADPVCPIAAQVPTASDKTIMQLCSVFAIHLIELVKRIAISSSVFAVHGIGNGAIQGKLSHPARRAWIL
jgi:hypothetical protein